MEIIHPQADQPEEVEVPAGEARVFLRVEAPPGTRVRITIETGTSLEGEPTVEVITQPGRRPSRRLNAVPSFDWPAFLDEFNARAGAAIDWLRAHAGWTALAMLGSLVIYLVVRLIRLADFPIYFFTDEAVNTVLAADFIRDGLRGYDGQFFPTFFYNAYYYSLGPSVYAQILPTLLFGKSIVLTRSVSVLFTLIAAFSAGLMLKNIFKSPYPWLAVLMLSLTPAWFLHSRTAFETVMATSFYAGFLYCYMQYRSEKPAYLFGAVVLAALAFYTYDPARLVVVLTALLLLVSDFKYHRSHLKVVWIGLGLTLALGLPLLRFELTHPGEAIEHLKFIRSYWVMPIPFGQKLLTFFNEYVKGLNPFYWFDPASPGEIIRHVMKGYGHLLWWTLPFFVIGLVLTLLRFRSSPYRALIIAMLAAPSGAALAGMGVTRAMAMVIPASLITAIGLSAVLEWLQKRYSLHQAALALPVFLVLGTANVVMMNDALLNGPFWFDDYGLSGLQYGANQVFPAVDRYAAANPNSRIFVSPSWANGTNTVARFFYPDPMPYSMDTIDSYIAHKLELTPNTVFVMIPEEYDRMVRSGKFADVQVDQGIPYPDNRVGFFFVRLRYTDNIEQVFAKEAQERKVLRGETLEAGGLPAMAHFSLLDMGSISNAFDGDPDTIIRTEEANPLVIELDFLEDRDLQSVELKVGGGPARVSCWFYDRQGNELAANQVQLDQVPNPRFTTLDMQNRYATARVRLEIENTNEGEPAHVHLWEVTLK